MEKRKIHLDILRIIACFMVIYNHTNERGFGLYLYREPGSLSFFNYLLRSTICKCGVPIFFMISGSLLLNKDESLKDTYKRIPRIAIDILLISLLYFWWDTKQAGNQFVLKNVLKTMITSNYWHLWYLYAYIAFIITLPFLRKLVGGLDKKASLYMLIVAILYMAVIPIIQFDWGKINPSLQPSWLIADIFIYPTAGYILDHVFQIEKLSLRFILAIGGAISSVCLIIGSIYGYRLLLKSPGNTDETFLKLFCLAISIAVFAAIKKLAMKLNFSNKAATLISEIGSCTFGVYLLHILILWRIPFYYNIWMRIEQGIVYDQSIGIFITIFLVFCICCAIAYGLRKIPLIRKLF